MADAPRQGHRLDRQRAGQGGAVHRYRAAVDHQRPAGAGGGGLRGSRSRLSPSTNTIPIRRLSLNQGERAEVRAAWLSFPALTLEPLVQTYVRTGESSYHYESSGGDFVTDLEVSSSGLVLRYPPLWEGEAGA
jgi:hypothetical protein